MTIFLRTHRLLSARLHDWFDRLEDPQQMARETLRELEAELDAATSATARSIAAERLIARRRDQLGRQLEDARRRAAEVFHSGNEAGARRALAHEFELKQSLVPIEQQLTEATDMNRALRAKLETMNRRLVEAQDRLSLQAARQATATAACQFARSDRSSTSGSAIVALDRALEKVERSTIEAEVQAELLGDVRSSEQPADASEQDAYVERELERLRTTGS